MKKFLLFTLFFLKIAQIYSYEFGICTVFKNDSRFLKEWIEYHRLVGVDHFWLYNNDSSDNYKEVLAPYIYSGLVELIDWPSSSQIPDNVWHYTYIVQTGAFNDAIQRSRENTKWLAIIDSDEFLVPVKENSILDTMEKYFPHVSGLCVNWQMYGTSNIKEIQSNELMIEKLIYKAPVNFEKNFLYKSIVKPKEVISCSNPHFMNYTYPHYHVNANGDRMHIENPGVYIDKIRINHYWTRDEKFLYDQKIPRYQKWHQLSIQTILDEAERMNEIEDRIMDKYIPKISM